MLIKGRVSFAERRERLKERRKGEWQKVRAKVLNKLGDKCVRCGFSDPRALQIDHINGGGRKEYKEIKPWGVLQRVLKGFDGYQLLCANCNSIKRWENGEHR